LEYRGFWVSDLNKEGTSANADLLAAKDGRTWQIQVKGATEEDGWWFQYGHCNDANIAGHEPIFNSSKLGFYEAQYVALVSVKTPTEYSSIMLPVAIAERAAQINLDRGYRTPRMKDGKPKRPGKVWVSLDWIPNTKDAARRALNEQEVNLLAPFRNKWDLR